MQILNSGFLSSVTGAEWTNGVSTVPIDISKRNRSDGSLTIWSRVTGDTGRTGGSVALFWKAGTSKQHSYYGVSNVGTDTTHAYSPWLIKNGTTVSGVLNDGVYLKNIICHAPWLRLQATASGAGSTQHGTAATNTVGVAYCIMGS